MRRGFPSAWWPSLEGREVAVMTAIAAAGILLATLAALGGWRLGADAHGAWRRRRRRRGRGNGGGT